MAAAPGESLREHSVLFRSPVHRIADFYLCAHETRSHGDGIILWIRHLWFDGNSKRGMVCRCRLSATCTVFAAAGLHSVVPASPLSFVGWSSGAAGSGLASLTRRFAALC